MGLSRRTPYIKCSVGLICCCVERDSGLWTGIQHSKLTSDYSHKRLISQALVIEPPISCAQK